MGGEIRNWGVRASIWRASRRSQQSAFVRNYVVSGKVVGVGDKDGCFFALDGRPIFSSFVSGKIGFWPAETPDLLGGLHIHPIIHPSFVTYQGARARNVTIESRE